MTEIAEGRMEAAIDTEIVQEILYCYGAIKEWEVAVTMANNLLTIVSKVYSIHTADICLAITLFEQYASKSATTKDVIHVVVMQINNLTKIVSTDTHFILSKDITHIDHKTRLAESKAEKN